MAQSTFDQLPANPGLSGNEIVPIDTPIGGGNFVTGRTTAAQIANLASAVGPVVLAEASPLYAEGRVLAGTAGDITVTDGGPLASIAIDLANTTVTPGTYGNTSAIAQFTVDQKGRIQSAGNIDITGTYQPLSANLTSWAAIARAAGFDTFTAIPSSANLRALTTDESGTGALLFQNGNLGTPTGGVLTNTTGLPVTTGIAGLATNMAAFLAGGTSAQLATAVTDETGSGQLVFATSPALVTPNLGTPSAAVLTNATGLPVASGISGLAANMAAFLAGGTSAQLAATVTDETGSGSLVFGTSPVITLNTASTAVTQTPGDSSTKLATTAFVQAAIFATTTLPASKYATTAALPAVTYANGASGVGATLTENANGALTVDGVAVSVNDVILVKNQASTFQNGVYTVTATGSAGAPFVLTRATYYNLAADINLGDTTYVSAGSTLAGTSWSQNGTEAPVIGTNPISFAQVAGPGTYTAGNGLSLSGTQFAIDTSITVDKTTSQTLTNKTLDTAAGNSLSIAGVAMTANSGTGAVVRATSPALVTPALGTPSALVLTNATGLPIAGGGTGQATASAAFDALSPTTTRGDMIFRNATTNARLAASTAGYLLQTNGAGTDPTYAGFLQAGTGAVTRTWQDKNRDLISPKDFGVVGNGVSVVVTASITSGAATLTATGATFTSADVGKSISVPGAATGGGTLVTTISVFTDATHVTLSANAGATVSAVSTTLYYGTDDTTAWQNCVTFANGQDIWIAGLSVTISSPITVPSAGLVIRGRGRIVFSGTGSLFLAGTFVTTTYPFTATAGQTVFVAADAYTGAYVEVYQNGALRAAWTQTITHDATNITATFLTGGAALNDAIQIRVTRATVSGLGAYSMVVVGSGVEINTTLVNSGRAFQLAWPDTGFLPGRQYISFVMEQGSVIRGIDGTRGFTNAIWLHAAYNARFSGDIYGRGANLIGGTTTDDTLCQWAVYLTGEWTSSDFRFYGGSIGNYYAGVGTLFSTVEGIMITNFVFLEVGYAAYYIGRSNDEALLLSMIGCHANCQLGVAYTNYVSQCEFGGNDIFQSTKSTKAFFRFIEFGSADGLTVHDNNVWSFVTGANCGFVVANSGTRGLRVHNNYLQAADATSVWFGVQCASGSFDCVIGPNTYENIDQGVVAAAGSDRIGVITVGDDFIAPPGVTNPRYSMSGTNWWVDQKWLVVQNSSAQSIPNNTGTSFAYTEVRDPESIYISGTIATPAWATRARLMGNLKWAANAAGTRFLRLIIGGSTIGMEQIATISSFDNTAIHSFDVTVTVASGNTLDMQLLQTSGGALNLNTSQMFVLFT